MSFIDGLTPELLLKYMQPNCPEDLVIPLADMQKVAVMALNALLDVEKDLSKKRNGPKHMVFAGIQQLGRPAIVTWPKRGDSFDGLNHVGRLTMADYNRGVYTIEVIDDASQKC